ncbi:hypothetical protein [Paraburkholderia kururiensis]|nr:hypothetical protein [Paraburkholderia kururiensis]
MQWIPVDAGGAHAAPAGLAECGTGVPAAPMFGEAGTFRPLLQSIGQW